MRNDGRPVTRSRKNAAVRRRKSRGKESFDKTETLRRIEASVHELEMLRAGDRAGVAVSGGADSVALLLLLEELSGRLGIVLSVVHFNHKLRGRASEADERLVRKLAAEHGFVLQAGGADVATEARLSRRNIEDAARRLRYAFFEQLVKEGKVDQIAVAHTADDQAETVLAHMLRGTGLAGLGGIHPIAGHVVRPLLGVRREALRQYLNARKQSWREDETNRDLGRLRARIRRKLLPLLEKEFQNRAVEHLCRLADQAREDERLLGAIARERADAITKRNADGVRIRISDLLAPAMATETGREDTNERWRGLTSRVLRELVEREKSREGEIGSERTAALLRLVEKGQSGKKLELPGGVVAERDLDELWIHQKTGEREASGRIAGKGAAFRYPVDLKAMETEVTVREAGCVMRLKAIDWPARRGETDKERVDVLDRDLLREPLVVRNWAPGDAYRPAGSGSRHKLKRMLLEQRIRRSERESWPVLTSGGAIAWARGFPVSAEFAASERTQKGIVIAEEKI